MMDKVNLLTLLFLRRHLMCQPLNQRLKRSIHPISTAAVRRRPAVCWNIVHQIDKIKIFALIERFHKMQNSAHTFNILFPKS